MDLVLAALLMVVVALQLYAAARSDRDRRTARQLARIERKLQLTLDHLGVVEDDQAPPQVRHHLERGDKLQAIKAYREATGSGLKEAKDAVDELAIRYGR